MTLSARSCDSTNVVGGRIVNIFLTLTSLENNDTWWITFLVMWFHSNLVSNNDVLHISA